MSTTVETLRAWSHFLFWAAVLLPILGAIAGVARFYVDRRERALSSEAATAELQQLRTAVAPRALTADQRKVIQDTLLSSQPASVIVASKLMDSESAAYGDQFAEAIGGAGWQTQRYRTSLNDFEGVAVSSITSKGEPVVGHAALTDALQRAGVNLQIFQVPQGSIGGTLPEGTLLLVVGRK